MLKWKKGNEGGLIGPHDEGSRKKDTEISVMILGIDSYTKNQLKQVFHFFSDQ
jgi:hypothetical protein